MAIDDRAADLLHPESPAATTEDRLIQVGAFLDEAAHENKQDCCA